jgi:ComF family protein
MMRPHAVRAVLTATADAVIAFTLAPRCISCDAPLDEPTRGCVCRPCWNLVVPAQAHSSFSESITLARAGGDFEGALRDAIHAFKYEGRRSLASSLGGLMRSAGADLLRDAHCVVPVPLHPWRHFRRGFNQASDLARTLGPPVVHALWRVRATTSQSGLTAAARRRNVGGAFILSRLLRPQRRDRLLRDRVVVLVDDVRTTGATLNVCATVLLAAGVREVRALTAAARELPS